MHNLLDKAYQLLNSTRQFDFIAAFLLRLYLVPIFWMAGTKKFYAFDSTVDWFGNEDWGLGLPMPWLLVYVLT